ncbi:MAG: Imm40 family immunity protein [Bacteroidales bacterium]|nr:Imm40 family immunity protein [Bacteroidales bacterium]MDP2234916.1 Imm40 family immunity protein [Bacteroidales bacterium]
MKSISLYLDFLKEKGKPLSEINPGSDEIALTVRDALHALDLLKVSQIAILGGDVLSGESNELIYAYQVWGEEYLYLNWYCDKAVNENKADYLQRSYLLAREGIIKANKTAEKLRKECYIVLVIE